MMSQLDEVNGFVLKMLAERLKIVAQENLIHPGMGLTGAGQSRKLVSTLSRTPAPRTAGRASFHNSRNADAIGSRAARMAGNNPPIKPISAAQIAPRTSNSGVTRNANVIWLKLCQFIVEV